tara:strand:- start:148 stop:1485 length:1338 start_codon:yes stop_codon:yes gene_type:complete
MNNPNFLLKSNIDRLYASIKDRIYGQINYNIDTKKDKFNKIINKLLIKISKKTDLNVSEMNSVAVQTICPFLISKIQNTKISNTSFTQPVTMDRMIPSVSKSVEKPSSNKIQSYMEDYNNSNNLNTMEELNKPTNIDINDTFLKELKTDPSSDMKIENSTHMSLMSDQTPFSNDGFNTLNDPNESSLSGNIKDTVGNTRELQLLREELKELKSKINPDKFLNKYQVTDNTILHKTILTLDIVNDDEYPKSGELFIDQADDVTTHAFDIRDFVIQLNDSVNYPPGTEVWLEYFSINNFKLIDRTSEKNLKRFEEIESFIITIRGGKFETLRNYSNTRALGELSTIVIPNDGYGNQEYDKSLIQNEDGVTSTIYSSEQDTYVVKPKSGYIGTFREGGIIDELKLDLIGTFIDDATVPETGHNTWAYLHPTKQTSRCSICIILKPPPM